jgi:hypothetical protein
VFSADTPISICFSHHPHIFLKKSAPQKRLFCAFLYQNLPRPFGISNTAERAAEKRKHTTPRDTWQRGTSGAVFEVQHENQRDHSRLAGVSGLVSRLPVCPVVILRLASWLWFFAAGDSAWRAVSLVAVLAVAALVGITWYLSRAHADRRWRAALDRYAQQEQAKRTYSRRNSHARPQSQAR